VQPDDFGRTLDTARLTQNLSLDLGPSQPPAGQNSPAG
jgi:hypothetical protein